jgi:hypothetical protein
MAESTDTKVINFRNSRPNRGESPYPDIATIVKLGINGDLDGLWKEISQFADKDPAYGYIENTAAHYGWGRERLATVLAAALLVRSEDWRGDMAEMLSMIPAPTVVISAPAERVQPSSDHRGPGC